MSDSNAKGTPGAVQSAQAPVVDAPARTRTGILVRRNGEAPVHVGSAWAASVRDDPVLRHPVQIGLGRRREPVDLDGVVTGRQRRRSSERDPARSFGRPGHHSHPGYLHLGTRHIIGVAGDVQIDTGQRVAVGVGTGLEALHKLLEPGPVGTSPYLPKVAHQRAVAVVVLEYHDGRRVRVRRVPGGQVAKAENDILAVVVVRVVDGPHRERPARLSPGEGQRRRYRRVVAAARAPVARCELQRNFHRKRARSAQIDRDRDRDRCPALGGGVLSGPERHLDVGRGVGNDRAAVDAQQQGRWVDRVEAPRPPSSPIVQPGALAASSAVDAVWRQYTLSKRPVPDSATTSSYVLDGLSVAPAPAVYV